MTSQFHKGECSGQTEIGASLEKNNLAESNSSLANEPKENLNTTDHVCVPLGLLLLW